MMNPIQCLVERADALVNCARSEITTHGRTLSAAKNAFALIGEAASLLQKAAALVPHCAEFRTGFVNLVEIMSELNEAIADLTAEEMAAAARATKH